jgi:hypothetical protein
MLAKMAAGFSVAALLVGCGPTRNLARYVDDAVRAWEEGRGVLLVVYRERIETAASRAGTSFDQALAAIPEEVRDYADDALCVALDLDDGKSLVDVVSGVLAPYQVQLRQAVEDIETELDAGQPYEHIARSALLRFA